MAEVTVKQLAEDVGAPVDRLLKQIVEAGLKARSENDSVSSDEKQQLLAYLRKTHGEADAEPRKITLKRKTTTTLKAGKAKTVNVEVRKRRTYIKRAELQPEAEAPKPEEPVAEQQPEQAPVEEAPKVAAEQAQQPEAEKPAEAATAEQPEQAEKAEPKKEPEPEPEPVPAPEDMPMPPPEGDGKDRKPKKKKEKVRERGDEIEEGKPKKKQAGHRGPRSRPVEEPLVISEDEEETTLRKPLRAKKKPKEKRHAFERPTKPMVREVEIPETISVGDLAQRMAVKSADVIKTLMGMGVMATINQALDQETAVLVTEELGHKAKTVSDDAFEEEVLSEFSFEGGEKTKRAPVVSVMGHVDHGKTSLLDYIRRTKVASGESGGITQHIGAYHVETDHGMVSFLDTPGHAAFTAMRARGAQCTDIVVLVVAADDGVMPQTKEAVQHARSAGVPIVVAINKMDKEEADPDRVKTELAGMEVIPEDWGGDVQFVPVSAHTGEGIEDLLEALLLQAEVLELEAATDAPAKGVVVESSLERGRGSVATVLVQNGTLRQGDMVVAGSYFGKVRAMTDEAGKQVKEAGPSIPVEILGLNGTPDAGDEFFAVADEKKAKELAEFRQSREREQRLQRQQAAKLENLFENMGKDEVKTLNVVLKTDVRGSLEAITKALQDLGNDEVQVKIVSSGVGGIAETDVSLAMATNAVIFGFNVRADTASKRLVEQEGLDLRYYSIIYNLIDDVKAALTGMLAPEFREDIVGIADVRDVFRSPKFGQVAGCMVTEGTVYRNKPIRVLRDNVVIFEGELESLRRFKDDVPEVRNGMECGIGVKGYDVKVGDQIEVFDRVRVERKLESTGA
ncbi:bacterial translation initiation factor 2 (bIF-2) [Marinobacter sp. DSM 26671]|jgi:translation initiation factor IF-2|uniref:Translation initiation factor IF-2 n=1 Tax=Marinobacter adhaerens TaxID=1033846 RepID=A0A352IT66_9GAMM|nr:translation initiation factor IF-2 [Marinobacter sp. DSM 26671]MBI47281.1 translation initiation factor IF-2 [Marinobacter sp.]HBC34649.1 translation initiation factor IF-2 [Marinobacter adhaerens]MBQ91933.1 translation initiation factor IF-2 [Marinobacter sp.]PHS46566.1 MAG: translation initiation factor IF-2 [Marinobacter sp.]SFE80131.1 bacterial translation initiation factor 2 (bIF-2) [Marinobacter sp. DSM 26671]|tara:strand:- start:73 stop:2622 length:2550 start_codon:yes stop_codon:yes gene_type:complete